MLTVQASYTLFVLLYTTSHTKTERIKTVVSRGEEEEEVSPSVGNI